MYRNVMLSVKLLQKSVERCEGAIMVLEIINSKNMPFEAVFVIFIP